MLRHGRVLGLVHRGTREFGAHIGGYDVSLNSRRIKLILPCPEPACDDDVPACDDDVPAIL